jgi:TonB-linked SusC/RagA family outer membrane protein
MKKMLLLFMILIALGAQAVFAQDRVIRGRVLDETGQGFPGAGITVKGTQTGTVTDISGNFSLEAPSGTNITLVVQAVGYGTQEVAATGGSVTVHLTSATKELQGAVVTALGIKREKRDLGYSATTLSNQDLTVANNVSALSSLEGKVAGANVTTTTGGPGGSVSVVLRGNKSLTGSNQALIVVDGIIINNYDRTVSSLGLSSAFNELSQVDFGNSGNDINPEDIQSLTVLDGPAAAALYGSEGANGAIIITTKSGSTQAGKNKIHVTYKGTYSLSDILKYPTLQNEFGQGSLYGQGDYIGNPSSNFSWGAPFNGELKPWGQIINGEQYVKPYSAVPNNVKDFFNHGKTGDNYVSVSGGNDTTNYFLSLDAMNNTGVVPNTFYNKYNIRFNANTQLTHTIYSSISFNYIDIYSKAENQGQSPGSVYEALYQTPRDIPIVALNNGSLYSSMNTNAGGVPSYGYYGAFTLNPYYLADSYNNYDKVDRLIGGITLGIRPVNSNLNIYDRIGVDVAADRTTFEGPVLNTSAFPQTLNYAPYNANYLPGIYAEFPHITQGYLVQNDANNMQINNDLIIDYAKNLSDKISIDALAGANQRIINSTSLIDEIDPTTNTLVIPGFYNFTNAQGAVQALNGVSQYREVGIYGDFKANYEKKLFLEVTGRNDWTSTLAPGANSYFYPSVGGSWVFTEGWNNNFTKNILDFGKIRASFASVGEDAGAYLNNSPGYVRSTVSSAFGSVVFPFSGVPGYQITNSLGDTSLRSERTSSNEIGTDLSFFKDRLSVSFTYYSSLTIDQIATIPVATSSGFAFETLNVGNVTNKGEEVSVRVTPISTKTGFRWDLFGTYTHNVNDVVSLANGTSQIVIGGLSNEAVVAQVGKPYGSFYGTDLLRDPKGQVIVNPSTGLPETTPNPVYGGSYQPRFIASWGTDLSYKGFSLHVLFTCKEGGVYYSETKSILDFAGNSEETTTNGRNPYVFPNSVVASTNAAGVTTYTANTTKFLPYNYYTQIIGQAPNQDLVDASYIRLSEAAFYYSIPDRWVKHTPFGKLEVGLYGTNLLLWTPKSNQYDDPEENSTGGVTNEQGFNFLGRMSMRTYGVSLKVVF